MLKQATGNPQGGYRGSAAINNIILTSLFSGNNETE